MFPIFASISPAQPVKATTELSTKNFCTASYFLAEQANSGTYLLLATLVAKQAIYESDPALLQPTLLSS